LKITLPLLYNTAVHLIFLGGGGGIISGAPAILSPYRAAARLSE